jgi:hypothetical protein
MPSQGFCVLVLGLGAVALTACAEPTPVAADASSVVRNIGIDLGSSARVRHVIGLAGEGEGYGRTESGTTPAAGGSMSGMNHGSMGRVEMDHDSRPGMGRGSTGDAKMDHGSMPAISHGASGGMQMDHGSMPGMQQ